jgi:hypothetical protein
MPGDPAAAARRERDWQRDQLEPMIRELVLEDQKRRYAVCWFAFAYRPAV